jgi:hypothetical protein
MTDTGRGSNVQLPAEWEAASAALVSNVQLATEWEPASAGLVSDLLLVVEWEAESPALVNNLQLVVEWVEVYLPGLARLDSVTGDQVWFRGAF